MKIAVGIATIGRAGILAQVVAELKKQTRSADTLYICPVSDSDVEGLSFDDAKAVRVEAERGLTKQRNAILEKACHHDILIFFDDDFIPHPGYVAAIEQAFQQHKDAVILTGKVLLDGKKVGGLSIETALNAIEQQGNDLPSGMTPCYSAYGCNMAIRMETIVNNDIQFDERLPQYSWLEDLDLTRRIIHFGKSYRVLSACGVHLANQKGKISGVRYGYSQIANPVYLYKKCDNYRLLPAFFQAFRNLLANSLKYYFAEPYIDRKGRFKGNWLGIKDLLRSKLDPGNIDLLD